MAWSAGSEIAPMLVATEIVIAVYGEKARLMAMAIMLQQGLRGNTWTSMCKCSSATADAIKTM